MPPLKKPSPYWGRPEHLHRRLEEEHDERMKLRLMAILMLMEGKSQTEVAQELNVSTATLRIWRRRWNQGGVAHLAPRWSGSAAMAEVRQVMRKYGRDIQRLRAYFSRPVALHVIIPKAKCSMAMKVSVRFSQRMRIRRKRLSQLCVRSTTQRRALKPASYLIDFASSPRERMCAVKPNAFTNSRTSSKS